MQNDLKECVDFYTIASTGRHRGRGGFVIHVDLQTLAIAHYRLKCSLTHGSGKDRVRLMCLLP